MFEHGIDLAATTCVSPPHFIFMDVRKLTLRQVNDITFIIDEFCIIIEKLTKNR